MTETAIGKALSSIFVVFLRKAMALLPSYQVHLHGTHAEFLWPWIGSKFAMPLWSFPRACSPFSLAASLEQFVPGGGPQNWSVSTANMAHSTEGTSRNVQRIEGANVCGGPGPIDCLSAAVIRSP